MPSTRTVSTRSVLRLWLALGAVFAMTVGGLSGLARAADDAPSPLKLVKILRQSDFTQSPLAFTPVGLDAKLREAVFYAREANGSGPARLYLVDTRSLAETETIPTEMLSGSPSDFYLDPNAHVVYIAGQISRSVTGCSVGAPVSSVCAAASPTALQAPTIETVSLLDHSKHLLTLPDEAIGQQLVAMTMSADSSTLYALLHSDPPNGFAGEHGIASSLTLYAIDVAATTGATSPAHVRWTYGINSCASLVSESSAGLGNGSQEFLGVDPAGRFVYFACRGLISYTLGAHLSADGAIVVNFPKGRAFAPDPSTSGFGTEFYPNGAAAKFGLTAGDASRNLLYLATTGTRNYVRVFNAAERAWTGTVPFASGSGSNLFGIGTDAAAGRAYLYYGSPSLISAEAGQVPVDHGVPLPLGDATNTSGGGTPLIDPATHRIFLAGRPDGSPTEVGKWQILSVLADTRPPVPTAVDVDPDAKTHQVDLTPDTDVSYSGFASAYGAKAIAYGTEHLGDSSGNTPSETVQGLGSTCTNGLHQDAAPACTSIPPLPDGTRSVVVGQVEDSELSSSAAKAKATALAIDDTTHGNVSTLSSINLSTVVSGGPPVPTPRDLGAPESPDVTQQYAPSSCGDFGGKSVNLTGQDSGVVCDHNGQQAGGAAVSPLALQQPGLEVATAASSTLVRRTVDNSVETVANAIARGIRVAVPGGPTITIGEVTATASSKAAGRTGTASSSFVTKISQVTVQDPSGAVRFRCGFEADADANCDPRQLTAVVNQLSPSPVLFLTPSPNLDPRAKASPGGAQAQIIKSPYQYWNDYFTDGDNGFEVPGLQIVMVADQDQPSRLTLELAGVHVESHDEIGTPPPPQSPQAPGQFELMLLDDATPPNLLSGATFALQGPTGTDPLTCRTAADGIGTCLFKDVKPGSYTISETTPPPGFAAIDDYTANVKAGDGITKVTLVNLAAIGKVELTLVEPGDTAAPLSGGVFALQKGKSVLDTPLATCTTGADGTCAFDKVPLGDYTMEQVSAPEGFLVSDPVEFNLTKPAQVAKLRFVDGLPGMEAVPPTVIPGKPAIPPTVIPGKPAVPPKVIPGKPGVPPRTMMLPAVGGDASMPSLEPAAYAADSGPAPIVASQPADALSLGSGGLRAVSARLARLVIHSPQQAVLLLFVWFVLGLPMYLWVRRQQFVTATEGI
jgi:hypothetical protein